MKTNVSIKFNSIKEYREIEKKLEEMGYVNDKEWNERHLANSSARGYCYINSDDSLLFSVFGFYDDEQTYSLEEFLKD